MADEKPKHEIISRKDAKAKGVRYYFTGKPCKHGHLGLRRVSETGCAQCSGIKLKKWRLKNRDKSKAIDAAWRTKNKEILRAQERARYAKNPAKYIAKTRRYYEKNWDDVRRKRIDYHYRSYQDDAVREKAQQRTRRWAKENPERARAWAVTGRRNRRAKEFDANGSHSPTDVAAIFLAQKGKCAYCRKKVKEKYEVDHIVPLAKGGANDKSNLQITCPKCNREKGSRDPLFHARMLGMLL